MGRPKQGVKQSVKQGVKQQKTKRNKDLKIRLGNGKHITVNKFKGETYVHLWDNSKGKNVSMAKKEFARLSQKIPAIADEVKKMSEQIEESGSSTEVYTESEGTEDLE